MYYKAFFEDEETACNFSDYIIADGWTVDENGVDFDKEKRMYVVQYTKF